MNVTSASLADTASSSAAAGMAAPSRRVVDAPTRVFHWLMALCFVGAYATADGERWRMLHVTLGYTMVGLLGFRIVWGLVGPRPARFSAWGAKLKAWRGALAQLRQGHWPGTVLQNLGMTLAVVGMLAAIALTTATGWITYQEFTGDWMEELHEFAGNMLLTLVLAHIAGVLALSLLRRRNLAATMVSGRMPGRGPDLVKRNAAWLGGLMLAAVLGFWWQQWQAAPANGGSAQAQQVRHADQDDDD